MRKIPTVYLRDENDRAHVTTIVNPQCDWVLLGEGTPRRKWDGTCVMSSWLEGGKWYARREVKADKNPPAGWHMIQYDPITGKRVGWEPVEQSSFAKQHAEALTNPHRPVAVEGGTYELIGPKINGNPERADRHLLMRHVDAQRPDELWDASVGDLTPPRLLVRFLASKYGWEGVVWTHPDGRMAKLKARDLPPVEAQ